MNGSRELTVREVAERINKHYVTTLNLIYKGYLRAVKRGGTWFVTAEEVERFIREGNYKSEGTENEKVDCSTDSV
ncbi:MAG TPA: helix-turn-helix domain-containing protein [Bacillota bacterium]|nr:helix-turn-helix domain-containing protein [Bacillota bacterium]HPT61003.1 helix-turn-helix domain-containing protein [Bacillota bacterium]